MQTKKEKIVRAAIPVLFGILFAVLVHNSISIQDSARSPQVLLGIASGMLALSGFLVTTRSFLVFKMHESVYKKKSYRERVWGLQGTDTAIYNPLQELDKKLGGCLWSCCLSTAALWVSSLLYYPNDGQYHFLPDISKIVAETLHVSDVCFSLFLAEISFGMILFTLVLFARVAISMNRNFKSIIDQWEAESKEMAKEYK